jgi:GNAT superfamily N-acetyltransferase
MEEVEVRPLGGGDINQAAKLLAGSFVDDQGMRMLFAPMDGQKLIRQMEVWFTATIAMWLKHNMPMFVAEREQQIVGVLLGGNASFAVSGIDQLKWAMRLLFACGLAPILRTAAHDHDRRKHVPHPRANIVEFVAVAPHMRGQRLGQKLFAAYEIEVGHTDPIWLETTRQENLSIFHRLGYEIIGQSETMGVKFTQMQKG